MLAVESLFASAFVMKHEKSVVLSMDLALGGPTHKARGAYSPSAPC